MSKHKKAKKAKKQKAHKAIKTNQTKVDQLQTQLNDRQYRLDSVLRVYGDDTLLDFIVRGTEREVSALTFEVQSSPAWMAQMGKKNPKLKKGLDKQALYYQEAKTENKELLDLLKQVVKQRAKIAKLHLP